MRQSLKCSVCCSLQHCRIQTTVSLYSCPQTASLCGTLLLYGHRRFQNLMFRVWEARRYVPVLETRTSASVLTAPCMKQGGQGLIGRGDKHPQAQGSNVLSLNLYFEKTLTNCILRFLSGITLEDASGTVHSRPRKCFAPFNGCQQEASFITSIMHSTTHTSWRQVELIHVLYSGLLSVVLQGNMGLPQLKEQMLHDLRMHRILDETQGLDIRKGTQW